jgi:hypothetical protein
MKHEHETAPPAPLGQVERGVGRPVPKRANLPSDISRCEGDNGASQGAKCRDCARREQLQHDDPTRWFSVMLVRPRPDGSCPYWMREVYA